ncbi:unnamed protein product, partial [Choristocarpus tenellus]
YTNLLTTLLIALRKSSPPIPGRLLHTISSGPCAWPTILPSTPFSPLRERLLGGCLDLAPSCPPTLPLTSTFHSASQSSPLQLSIYPPHYLFVTDVSPKL